MKTKKPKFKIIANDPFLEIERTVNTDCQLMRLLKLR